MTRDHFFCPRKRCRARPRSIDAVAIDRILHDRGARNARPPHAPTPTEASHQLKKLDAIGAARRVADHNRCVVYRVDLTRHESDLGRRNGRWRHAPVSTYRSGSSKDRSMYRHCRFVSPARFRSSVDGVSPDVRCTSSSSERPLPNCGQGAEIGLTLQWGPRCVASRRAGSLRTGTSRGTATTTSMYHARSN